MLVNIQNELGLMQGNSTDLCCKIGLFKCLIDRTCAEGNHRGKKNTKTKEINEF